MAGARLDTPARSARALRTRLQDLPGGVWRAITLKNLTGWPPEKATRETAWLDGLRGVAAFFVTIGHYGPTFWRASSYEAPFGAIDQFDAMLQKDTAPGAPPPHVYDLFRLPILRIWMSSGHTQVSIFFVLSGMVLSWAPLQKVRQGQTSGLAASLSSAAFRRWLRLYLPCFAIAFWEMIELRLGWRTLPTAPLLDNLFLQIWDFVKASATFSNPFSINRGEWEWIHRYDWTMWTIPYEFAGSLLVFIVVLAVSRFRSFRKRSAVLLLVAVSALVAAQWNFWLFATGVLFSNYVLEKGGFNKLGQDASWTFRSLWALVLLIGLLLGGVPSINNLSYDRPGYEWLDQFVPESWLSIEGGQRLWWCWAGILIVVSSSHIPVMRRFFALALMRYMGRVSFMLYLIHRVGLNLSGQPLKLAIFKPFGRGPYINVDADGAGGYGFFHGCVTALIYFILLSIFVPASLFAAHWCEVLIDAPSTRLARRVDDWLVKGGLDQGEKSHELEVIRSHTQRRISVSADTEGDQVFNENASEDAPLLLGSSRNSVSHESQPV